MSYYGYIESAEDAMILFEAYRLGRARVFNRRMSEKEKQELIVHPSVFIWIEENDLKRWTDGRKWSPSRVIGHFLTYQEKPAIGDTSSATRRYLTKRTISASLKVGTKLHIVAYFYADDITGLATPTSDHQFADITIQKELYEDLPKYAAENARPRVTLFSNTTMMNPSMVEKIARAAEMSDDAAHAQALLELRFSNLHEENRFSPAHKTGFSGDRLDTSFPPGETAPRPASRKTHSFKEFPFAALNTPVSGGQASAFNSLVHDCWRPNPVLTTKECKLLNDRAIKYLIANKN